MNIYFISGLGVDKRVFKRLQLPPDYTIHYLEWIQPLARESFSSYAQRLSSVIDQNQQFVLIGLSFGGMLAIEMIRFVKPVKTILLSSAVNSNELPVLYKVIGFLRLHKIVPAILLKRPNAVLYWLFGMQNTGEKLLFKQILKDTDIKILKWSIHTVLTWKKTIVSNVIHIHGDRDFILPIQFTKPDVIIKGGTHFMVYSRAEEVSQVLTKILQS